MSRLSTPLFYLLSAIAITLTPHQVSAAAAQRVQIDLVSEQAAVRPGDTVTIALRQMITPGWHTYWVNPGDSGEPTQIDWKLPQGASAGPIQWPLPHAIPIGPLMNFGYSGDVVLLSDIKVPASASGQSFDIAADVKWLVCSDICVPEEGAVNLSLPLLDRAVSPRPSAWADLIAAAREKVPVPMPWPARFSVNGNAAIALKVDGVAEKIPPNSKVHFFPLEWGKINHAAPQNVSLDGGSLVLSLVPGDLGKAVASGPLEGVLAVETPGKDGAIERHGYSISAVRSKTAVAPAPISSPIAGEPRGGLSLALALGFAFLGGLILNLMPCVFPVLSLKALSLAKDAGNAKAHRIKGYVYLAGVLASFALIGVALVALRAGGGAIGWGMQFQSPAFVLVMMALFLALGLSLSGVFTLGWSLAGVGDGLTRHSGLAGYFFTGVLATVVATPCTAPFMGAAMGFAFTQPAPIIFAVLLALGLGFAMPIVLISLTPALGRWLPKPGAWMETFKQLMAFPLYATVGWLLWVMSIQQGSEGVLAGIVTLIGIAFAAWLFGRDSEAGILRATAAALIALLAIGLGTWTLAGAAPQGSATAVSGESDSGPRAETFTRARLAALIAEGKPVFVNLTAAWCITCKLNERIALRTDRVAEAFRDRGIAYLVGDWTSGNPEITELLRVHGRVGVPLYLLYSGAPGAEPEILPQLLTESIVMDHLAGLPAPPLKQAKGEL